MGIFFCMLFVFLFNSSRRAKKCQYLKRSTELFKTFFYDMNMSCVNFQLPKVASFGVNHVLQQRSHYWILTPKLKILTFFRPFLGANAYFRLYSDLFLTSLTQKVLIQIFSANADLVGALFMAFLTRKLKKNISKNFSHPKNSLFC